MWVKSENASEASGPASGVHSGLNDRLVAKMHAVEHAKSQMQRSPALRLFQRLNNDGHFEWSRLGLQHVAGHGLIDGDKAAANLHCR